MIDLNEIKEALSKATPGPWKFNGNEIVAVSVPRVGIAGAVSEEDSELIGRAPEWLASLVTEAERWEKEARLQYRLFNEEIDKSRDLRGRLVTAKDVECELIKICDDYRRQVEKMQKTQSLILKRVADISPALAESIIQEFGLEGEE